MATSFRYAQSSTISGGRRFASRLTPQEEEIIKVSFESFSEEAPGDGGRRFIDSEKLRAAFESIDASGDMQDIQLLIDDIDENGDGNIDEDEWRHIMSRKFLGEDDDSSFQHVFAMLDDNKDGYIPLVEFRKMLMQEGQAPLSEQEVDELLMFADTESDGLIDYRQFLLWLAAPQVYHKDKGDQQAAIKDNPVPQGSPKGSPKALAVKPGGATSVKPAAAAAAAQPPAGSPTSSTPGAVHKDTGGGVGHFAPNKAEQELKLAEVQRELKQKAPNKQFDEKTARRVLDECGWDVKKSIAHLMSV